MLHRGLFNCFDAFQRMVMLGFCGQQRYCCSRNKIKRDYSISFHCLTSALYVVFLKTLFVCGHVFHILYVEMQPSQNNKTINMKR